MQVNMSAPIDMDFIRLISDGDVEFELELLETFVEDTKVHIDAAKSAIAADDYMALQRETHHMKGASGNVGAHAIQELASSLEQQAKQESLQEAEIKLAQLESHLGEVEEFMHSYAQQV
jgi:HPt (histidine-containing phosphotransfer) domain-containing protein